MTFYLQSFEVGPMPTNAYLLGCPKTKQAVVIDPGGEAETLLAEIHAGAWQMQAIINTHGHFDHIAANAALKKQTGAPILIGEQDAAMLEDAQSNLSTWAGIHVVSPPADRRLMDEEEIKVGELTLKVLTTPGHSPGGICLLLEPELLFTGDTLFAGSVGRTDFPGASYLLLLKSLARLAGLPPTLQILPGHGPKSTLDRERATNPFLAR